MDIWSTPSTLPLFWFWIRHGTPATPHGVLPPVAGNAVMRSRAAPIGTSVTCCVADVVDTGPPDSVPTTPCESAVQSGIVCACAVIDTGAPARLNGSFTLPPPPASDSD